jgi:AcrR family transcriptional regulator
MKTEDKIIETFLLLLESTPVENITVKLICETGNISRVTFYSYFSNLSSVYSFLIFDRFMHNKMNPFPNIKEGLKAAVNFVYKHQAFFTRILKSKQRYEFLEFLKHQGIKHHDRWLAKFDRNHLIPLQARAMMGHFYSSGLSEMFSQWVDEGYSVPKKDFFEYAYLFLKGYIELALFNFHFYRQKQKLPNREDIFPNHPVM